MLSHKNLSNDKLKRNNNTIKNNCLPRQMSNEDLGMLRKIVSEKNWSSACTTGTMQQQQRRSSFDDIKPLHPCRQVSVKNLNMVQEWKNEVWDQLPY
jgi:hypothetical protein